MNQNEPTSIDYAQVPQAKTSPIARTIANCLVVLLVLCDLGKAVVLVGLFNTAASGNSKDFSIGCTVYLVGGSAVTFLLCIVSLLVFLVAGVISRNIIFFRHRLIFALHAAADFGVFVAMSYGGKEILWAFFMFLKSI